MQRTMERRLEKVNKNSNNTQYKAPTFTYPSASFEFAAGVLSKNYLKLLWCDNNAKLGLGCAGEYSPEEIVPA